FQCSPLPFIVSRVALSTRVGRFVNDADDAFTRHPDKIRSHQVVMRHIHNAICRKCAGRQQEKKKQNAYGRRFHRRKNNPSDQSSNGIDVSVGSFMIFILIPTPFAAGNVAPPFEASRTSCPTLPVSKVPTQAKFGTMERLKRDKSAAKLNMASTVAFTRRRD